MNCKQMFYDKIFWFTYNLSGQLFVVKLSVLPTHPIKLYLIDIRPSYIELYVGSFFFNCNEPSVETVTQMPSVTPTQRTFWYYFAFLIKNSFEYMIIYGSKTKKNVV